MSGRMFGLDADELRRLVVAVLPVAGDRPGDDWADRFARAAWTTLAEPGDGVAGALIEAIGASAALDLVIARANNTAVDGRATAMGARDGGVLDSGSASASESVSSGVDTIDARLLTAGVARWLPRLSAVAVIRSLEQAARFGIACSTPDDEWWPTGLADLGPCAPIALWTRGDATAVGATESSVAIVGARAATGYGEAVAAEFAVGLGDRGVAVISGGAYGIDGSAHRAALAAGAATAAVLAGGLDRLYPVGHEELLRRVGSVGALVAEVPCGVPPTRWRFLQRNRLIAAMTGATVVVEAGHRSGSLNTAGHAAAIGRPLGAVPGAVTSAASAGCHRLLREYGATCVTSTTDVLELLGLDATRGVEGEGDLVRASASSTRVLDAVHATRPRTTAEIAGLVGLGIAETLAELGILESDGAIRRGDDGDWVGARRGAR